MSGKSRAFEQLVIIPTLQYLGVSSSDASQLLLGTALSESGLESCCNGEGIGVYGITSEQHRDVWDRYLAFHPDLASRVRSLASRYEFLKSPDIEMQHNFAYATAIAWLIYERSGLPVPTAGQDEELASFWRHYFHHGKALHWQTPAAA